MSALSVKDGLSAIAREVLQDVQKEAEAIIVAAEKDAKQTLRAAKEEADANYQITIDQATTQAAVEKRKITSLTEVEVRNQLLQTKETLVNAAFEKAQTQLAAFTKTEQYHEHLLALIEETAKKIGSKKLTVHVNAKDKEWLAQGDLAKLSKKLRFELSLSDQTEQIMGGCKIETADGKVVSDNTLENRLQELKPALRVDAARILFGKEA
jgi:V/A-type H+-transporting ATPase subunit E